MDKGLKVYVYGLINMEDEICYIGKTSNPKGRLSSHHSDGWSHSIRMKILDFFYDVENMWIHKLIKENHPIQNKEVTKYSSNHRINEIIDKKIYSFQKVKYNGKVYDSLNQLYTSNDINLSRYYLQKILDDPKCDLAKQYPIIQIQ